MKTINIAEVIQNMELTTKRVAEELFPGNSYPTMALKRITNGEAVLDMNQISRLSEISGLTIAELFNGEVWSSNSKTTGLIIFTNGKYRAELNTEDWTTKLFDKGTIFHETVIHSKNVPLSSYINSLDAAINNYVNN
jgi:hypothetical protein